jgi:hypothetical protein
MNPFPQMKRLLALLFALFGVSGAAQAQSRVEMADTKSIHYSMPTVAADSLAFAVPTRESFEGAPQFHEDEWSQVEFFPKRRLEEIKNILTEYKSFEQAHRRQSGWAQIYARHVVRHPVIAGADAVDRLADTFGAIPANAPILVTSSSVLGQVKGGFSVSLAPRINLYGLKSEAGIPVLGVILDDGAENLALTQAFAKLSARHNLILVDWRKQMVLVGVHNGEIVVWNP